MIQIIISRPGKFTTTTYKFSSLNEGSLFMMRNNLSHRIIDILENYSSVK
jgi:hypothetical protein